MRLKERRSRMSREPANRQLCAYKNAAVYQRQLLMTWIAYWKAFDLASHRIIVYLLESLKMNLYIVGCIQKLMSFWKTRFTIASGKHRVTTGSLFRGKFFRATPFPNSTESSRNVPRMSRGHIGNVSATSPEHVICQLLWNVPLELPTGT